MKVKISKTGEIKAVNHDQVLVHFSDGTTKAYKSISELSNDLSDYEEPKIYDYITDFGAIYEREIGVFLEDEEERKRIGNYFESYEEAQKAVEKLKAWKRLKDKGFRILGWEWRRMPAGGGVCVILDYPDNLGGSGDFEDDLDLLFGGEE